MQNYKLLKILKINALSLLVCILATFVFNLGLAACSSPASLESLERHDPHAAKDKSTPERLVYEWESQELKKAVALWKEEGIPKDGDKYSAGEAAYRIASIKHDPVWAQIAMEKFSESIEEFPNFALAHAGLGSSHSLRARDYPIQGWWQIIPGPGFIRIYHVMRAKSKLNDAVALAPMGPAVRLIRAATFSGIPGIFISQEVVDADFTQLVEWDNHPKRNPEYKEVLKSPSWKQRFYFYYAKELESQERNGHARKYWMKLAKQATSPQLRELGAWKAQRAAAAK